MAEPTEIEWFAIGLLADVKTRTLANSRSRSTQVDLGYLRGMAEAIERHHPGAIDRLRRRNRHDEND